MWLNWADFDPATLHDWPLVIDELTINARSWCSTPISFSGANLSSSARRERRTEAFRTKLAANQRRLLSTLSPFLLPIRTLSRGKN